MCDHRDAEVCRDTQVAGKEVVSNILLTPAHLALVVAAIRVVIEADT